MSRLLFVPLLAVLGVAIALSEVNQKCIAENSDEWSNNYLIGTWYRIYHFMLLNSYPPSTACTDRVFTRPSAEVIQQYKEKYNDPNAPYNIDDNPVQVYGSNGITDGLVFGHNIAKFYVLSPNSSMLLNSDGYIVETYQMLTPKYILYTECHLSVFKWLLTTDRHAPVEEMEELIKNTPELSRMEKQRYCATY